MLPLSVGHHCLCVEGTYVLALPGLLRDLHGTPWDNNSTKHNLLSSLEALTGYKRGAAHTMYSSLQEVLLGQILGIFHCEISTLVPKDLSFQFSLYSKLM